LHNITASDVRAYLARSFASFDFTTEFSVCSSPGPTDHVHFLIQQHRVIITFSRMCTNEENDVPLSLISSSEALHGTFCAVNSFSSH